jgi:metal-sulfur cluster biosynthetic enzyme
MITQDAVLAALRGVKDPQTQQDIVALGLVRDLAIEGDRVAFALAFTTPSPASRVTLHSMAT